MRCDATSEKKRKFESRGFDEGEMKSRRQRDKDESENVIDIMSPQTKERKSSQRKKVLVDYNYDAVKLSEVPVKV